MSTLSDTSRRIDSLILPYVQKHNLGDEALRWYIETYDEIALHEIFFTLCLRDPAFAAEITRLFVVSGDRPDLCAEFAASIGQTPDEIDRLLDPKTDCDQLA